MLYAAVAVAIALIAAAALKYNRLVRDRALAERYPDLNASNNVHELQKQLAETESHLQSARRFYNGAGLAHAC